MTRNEMTVAGQESGAQFNKKALELAVAGGVAFWATNFLISLTPIAAVYRAALSISYLPMVLVESLVGGLVIGFLVSYFLLRFSEKIPTKNPILKSMILSFAILLIIETFTMLFNLSNLSVYLLVGAGINVPRFLALGLVIGYVYDKWGDSRAYPKIESLNNYKSATKKNERPGQAGGCPHLCWFWILSSSRDDCGSTLSWLQHRE
jgi:hypothetical protein